VIGTERLLRDAVGRIQAVAVDPSGAILLANETALVRLSGF
jgi:glucose/arabinose dehydrogenase